MQINLTFDASVANAPGQFIGDIQAVAAYFDKQITNNIAVTITVGYGDIDGTPIAAGTLGESESRPASYSYSQVRSALAASASSASDISAVAALPLTAPFGASSMLVPQVEAGLLGLGGPGMSGHVGFSSTAAWDYSPDSTAAGRYGFTGAVAHEISEVLGRVSYYGESPLDLFRYSGPNQPNVDVFEPNYFSVDNGTTDLADFNTQFSGDQGDWATNVPNDASDAFAIRGQFSVVSPVDLVVLDTLGYTLASASRPITIAGTVASQPVSVRGSVNLFGSVTLTDPNAGRNDTATVTLSSPYEGSFSNLAGGSFNQITGAYTVSGTPSAVQNALDGLIFVPNAVATSVDQTTQTSLTLKVTDGLASASDSATSVIVTGIGSIAISGTARGQTVPTPGTIKPFAGVAVTDPNVGQTETLTITPSYAGHGSFIDLGGGSYDAATGAYTVLGSLAVVQRSLAGLAFVPSLTAVRTGNGATGFTIKVDDGLVSSSDVITTVIASPPVPPTISGTVSGQTVVATGAVAPFANVAIGDVNAGVTETLTVTLSTAGNGILGNTAGGTYDATRGIYTVSGSQAAVTAALDGLVFAPNEAAAAAPNAVGAVTAFTISVDDGAAYPVIDRTTSVAALTIATPLPDMASLLSPVARLALSQTLAVITQAGVTPNVVTVAGVGAAAPAPVAATLDALVIAAAAGSATALPAGYQAAYLLGANQTATDANGNTLIVVPANGDSVFAAAGDTVIAGNGAATLSAGGGAETLVGGTGANLIALGTGADRITSQGIDTIIGSSGSATVTASAAPLYFGGTGSLDLIATSGAPTLVGGGAETVNAGAAAALVFGGSGPLAFAQGSGASTVVGGAQAAVSLVGGSAPLLFFGNGVASYIPGSAVDTILGGTGSLTATGGANGTLFFGGTAGGNMIATGSGATTIIGGGDGDVLTATGPGADVIGASGGAETINAAAATGADVLFAGNGPDCLMGGAGTTAMVAGVGNDTLVSGIGSTLFLFFDAGVTRTEIVTGFNASMDFVELAGYAPGTAAAAISAGTGTNGDTTIALPDGTQITFQGVTNLGASSFV